jgi:CheY-like chemotaxis protein
MAHVLLADDDQQFRRMLERTLERAGHTVTAVGDGVAAIAAATRAPPDVAVLDLLMPEKEGLETLRELRQLHPGLPVIVMTGGGRGTPGDYLPAALLLGASAALEKPFSIHEFLQVIQTALTPPAP